MILFISRQIGGGRLSVGLSRIRNRNRTRTRTRTRIRTRRAEARAQQEASAGLSACRQRSPVSARPPD